MILLTYYTYKIGYCTEIIVSLNNDGTIEISDNGRGIPCSVHPTTGKSTLETVLCVLHAGGKFGGEESGYKVSGGLHGVGISVVNALSEKLLIEVHRGDGNKYSMMFAEGVMHMIHLLFIDILVKF